MLFAFLPVGLLALVVFVAVPVGGAPSLNIGSSATYNLSASISFSPFSCQTSPDTASTMDSIVCQMIVIVPTSVDINGTLAWVASSLNETTAVLFVTHNLTISSGDSLTTPDIRITRSFNESINRTTRIATIMPSLRPEIDEALQLAQNYSPTSLASTTDWASSKGIVDSTIITRPTIYTIWWVNGPPNINQTIPVLTFGTKVTGTTSLSLPNIGPRNVWRLNYTIPSSWPLSAVLGSARNIFRASFSFYYDEQSNLLLKATAAIHVGFFDTLPIPQCSPSATMACPAFQTAPLILNSGLDVQVTLTLANTKSLTLDQPVSVNTGSNPRATSGTSGGIGPSPRGGSATSSGSTGGTSGQSQGSEPSSGNNGGSGSTPNANPGRTPQTTSARPSPSTIPWLWILAAVTAMILVSILWLVRRRAGKSGLRTSMPNKPTCSYPN